MEGKFIRLCNVTEKAFGAAGETTPRLERIQKPDNWRVEVVRSLRGTTFLSD